MVYIVLEFDFDGKLSDVLPYIIWEDALEKSHKIRGMGGECEIWTKEIQV